MLPIHRCVVTRAYGSISLVTLNTVNDTEGTPC